MSEDERRKSTALTTHQLAIATEAAAAAMPLRFVYRYILQVAVGADSFTVGGSAVLQLPVDATTSSGLFKDGG